MFAGFIDHGMWEAYVPDRIPEGVPKNTMFAKRASDGKDWYDYVHSGKNFQLASVKFTVADTVIKAPTVDPTMLFPSNMRVIEMLSDFSGYTTDQLIDKFASKIVNITTGAITDPPPVTIGTDSLLARIEALEKKS